MKLRQIYLLLCLAGTLWPLWHFLAFLRQHGFDAPLFIGQLFANHISSFFAADVIVSALVVLVLIISETRRLHIRHGYLAIIGLCVGVSLALPLFLYLRQRHLDRMPA